jgi:hypothetical protein
MVVKKTVQISAAYFYPAEKDQGILLWYRKPYWGDPSYTIQWIYRDYNGRVYNGVNKTLKATVKHVREMTYWVFVKKGKVYGGGRAIPKDPKLIYKGK